MKRNDIFGGPKRKEGKQEKNKNKVFTKFNTGQTAMSGSRSRYGGLSGKPGKLN